MVDIAHGGTPLVRDRVAEMYDAEVTLVSNDVLSLAGAMPADKYDFAPVHGDFAGVRNFGEQVKHLATMIYMTAARVLEERSPYRPGAHNNGPDDVRTKDEIIAYLEGALAYARKAVASLTEENHIEPVRSAFGMQPRAGIAAGIASHGYNHYGQMVVYARMNGVVPPGSVPTTGDEGRVDR